MALRLYNTLTRSVQEFTPLNPPTVTMYVCGPTVYDEPHLGHLRSAFVFDILRRHLLGKQYEGQPCRVTFVRNVTDVDDKIIDKARQELGAGDLATACREVATRYLKSYHDALAKLGIDSPTKEPSATDHIAQMQAMIQQLLDRDMAYVAGGDVYFAVRKFSNYGRLSNRMVDELQTGARVEPGEHKRDPLDFALWKAAKPGEPSWDSPWGKGRPGWHIECSAMSTTYLGDAFDIHGGGVDLVFPHHENEIAQAQAAGKPFAKYWIHHGLVTVNGEKMSKSLGNYITVEQALAACRGHADALKLFFLSAHYRSPLDYNERDLAQAAARWDRWHHFLELVASLCGPPSATAPAAHPARERFEAAMDDDLNTPGALATLDTLISEGQQLFQQLLQEMSVATAGKTEPTPQQQMLKRRLRGLADEVLFLGRILGVFLQQSADVTTEFRQAIERLIEERDAARKRKDFVAADSIRETAKAKYGVLLIDSAGQTIWQRIP